MEKYLRVVLVEEHFSAIPACDRLIPRTNEFQSVVVNTITGEWDFVPDNTPVPIKANESDKMNEELKAQKEQEVMFAKQWTLDFALKSQDGQTGKAEELIEKAKKIHDYITGS